jgi:hypothetical protein
MLSIRWINVRSMISSAFLALPERVLDLGCESDIRLDRASYWM